jgi:hypothetical protein
MSRTLRLGRAGGLAASAAAATPFAYLWVLTMRDADDPLTAQTRLELAIWMAVFGTPWTARGGWWRPRRRRCRVSGATGGGHGGRAGPGAGPRGAVAVRGRSVLPGGAVGLRMGHRAGWAAGDRRLAAEAPRWYRQVGGLLLDADGGVGMGANLGDAIWWTLVVLVLWALPMGVLGAAAGSARARRQRAREHAELAPAA